LVQCEKQFILYGQSVSQRRCLVSRHDDYSSAITAKCDQ